jgi:ATP-dependent exoDNAse (exonuclease V) beta subunit
MERVDIFNSGHAFIIEEFAAEESHDALIYPSSMNTDKVLSLNISPNETHAPRDLQPSMLEGVADEVHVLLDEKRQRISVEKVDDDDTMAKVGTCVHDIFCAIEDNHNDQFVSSAILSHGMQQHLTNASSILLAWDWLVNFLTAQYGPAIETWHERPFKYGADGQIITGSIDLVWKTEKGCVVIDYKTYPNWKKDSVTTKSDKHYAGNYKGQLYCYEQALTLNGEKVIAKVIYYPVNGMIVQI